MLPRPLLQLFAAAFALGFGLSAGAFRASAAPKSFEEYCRLKDSGTLSRSDSYTVNGVLEFVHMNTLTVDGDPDPTRCEGIDARLDALFAKDNLGEPNIWIGMYVNDVDFTPLLTLPNIRGLTLTCYGDNMQRMEQIRALKKLRRLDILSLTDSRSPEVTCNFTKLEFLTELPQLEALTLNMLGKLDDVSSIANLVNLKKLTIHNAPLKSLAPMARMVGLRDLGLNQTAVTDIAPLMSLVNLQTLDVTCREGHPIPDLWSVQYMVNLTSLNIQNCGTNELGPVANLAYLKNLEAASNGIKDLTPLTRLTALENLNLWNNEITDIKPLEGLPKLRDGDGILYLFFNPLRDPTELRKFKTYQNGCKVKRRCEEKDNE